MPSARRHTVPAGPCPSCGWQAAALTLVPWGDGRQLLPMTPYLCQGCGTLGLLELATGAMRAVPECDCPRCQLAQREGPAPGVLLGQEDP